MPLSVAGQRLFTRKTKLGGATATTLDIDGLTDIGADLADADLIIVDDGGGGTNRKVAVTRVPTYVFSSLSLDEDNMASDSATKFATQQSIKAYVDARSITVSDGSSSTAITMGNTMTFSGTTNEIEVGESSGTVTIGLPDNVTIAGNLTVSGTTTTVSSSTVTVNDPLFALADNNSGDAVDIGWYGKYVDSGTKYSGLFRDASDSDKWKLFSTTGNSNEAPSTTVNTSSGFALATLAVNGLEATSFTLGGTAVSSTAAELNILDGVTSTTAELNLLDGGTSATSTTLADADRLIVNDGGTMKQVDLTDFETYFETSLDTLSNVTTVGALNSGSITSGFGTIDTGSSTITTTGLISGGSLDIDDVLINGTTIGHTDDTDLMTLSNGTLTIAGEISVTTLDIGGTNVTSTAAELNILDGVTSTASELNILDGVTSTATELNIIDGDTGASTVTLADADRVVVNDAGTMKQVALTSFETYFETALDTLSNVTTVGTIGTGVWEATDVAVAHGGTGASSLTANGVLIGNGTSAVTAVDMSTKGHILIGDGSGNPQALGVGSDDYILTADSSAGTGVAWKASGLGTFYLEDDDGTEVNIGASNEVKFIGAGITTNWTDTSTGNDGDPYDLTFTINAAQTGITSIYATDLIMGEDAETAIDFGTANEIDFKVDNAARLTLTASALYPVTDNQIDLGTSSLEFKDAFFDGTVTADAFAGPLTGNVTGTADTATVATTVTITDNESTNEENAVIFTAGGDVDGGNLGLESDGNLTYNPSSGTLTATAFAGALTGNVTGNASGTAATVTGAAQSNITSLGTLTTLTVDDVNINGKVVTMTGSTDDTAVMTVGTNGTLTIETTDTAAAAANIQITADGTAEMAGTTVTLDSGGAVVLDSATGILNFQDGGSTVLSLTESGSGDVTVKLETNAKDLIFTDNGDAEGFRILDAAAGVKVAGTIDIGHASDTTLSRASSGDVNIEGNIIYRAGGTDVPVADGGTGASTLTDGGVLLGSGTGAITAMAVLADGEMIVGDGTTDPVAESGATLRTSIGVGTGDSPQFTGIELGHASDTTIARASSGAITVEGTAVLLAGAQTGITSIYATDLILGEDSQTAIDFGTVNEIDFKVDNAARLTLTASALYPVTNNQIDLGTSSLEFKDAFFDGTVTADAFAGPLTGNVTGTADVATVATTVTITDNESTDEDNAIIFTAGGDVDGGNIGLESDGDLTYNPSSGTLSATVLAGTLSTAAQGNVTSLGTLTALTVDDVAVNGKVITMTGSTDDTAVMTVGTNGTLTIETTDTAAAAANIQITADGTAELAGTTVTLDSGGAVVLDSATGIVNIQDGGSTVLSFTEGNSGDVTVKLETNAKDLVFTDNGDATNMKILDAAAGINVPGEVQTTGIGYTDGDNAVVIADGGSTTFPQQLTITKNIALTQSDSDGDYSGVTAVFTSGEALEAGEVVSIHTDGEVYKALAVGSTDGAINAAQPAIGVVVADAADNSDVIVLLQGFLTHNANFPAYTVGATLYVPEAESAGSKCIPEEAAPDTNDDFVQVIGYAVHANRIFVNPDLTVIKLD